jgi:broad specificity phosphatase PhoE
VEAALQQIRPLDIRLILTSPMTRALQTAALLSRALDLPLAVEFDLHEWVPDRTYSWSTHRHRERFARQRWKDAWPATGVDNAAWGAC